MELTNKHGLPEAFVNAVKNDPYDSSVGDISVTKLIDAPHRRKLLIQNRDNLTTDVTDRVWALLGQAVHHVLERANEAKEVLREQRLVSTYNGMRLTGQFDTFNTKTGVLSDYKVTSVYKITNGQPPYDWIRQLNVLAQLLRDEFWDVKSIQIVAILRDWSSAEAERNESYPQSMVKVLELPLWSEPDTKDYINERVDLHKRVMAGDQLPCSDDERWAEPTTWALMKQGGKRAIRVFKHAIEVPVQLEANQYIEERKGGFRRCEKYCEVNKFCQFYEGEKNV